MEQVLSEKTSIFSLTSCSNSSSSDDDNPATATTDSSGSGSGSGSSSSSSSAASGTAYYFVEASNKECSVSRFDPNGAYKSLKSKIRNNAVSVDNQFSTGTVPITANGDTASVNLGGENVTVRKFTGDLYGYTNASLSGNWVEAVGVVLNSDGTGKYKKQRYLTDSGLVPDECEEGNITYTISGSTINVSMGGSSVTGSIGNGTITLNIGSSPKVYQKF